MSKSETNLEALKDIRSIMDRSSRFISLSGWSGVSAGVSALAGAWIANNKIGHFNAATESAYSELDGIYTSNNIESLELDLVRLAVAVALLALLSALFFTWKKSKKNGVTIWNSSAQRLVWNTLVPMIAGGVVILRLMDLGQYVLIAPVCLIFYGVGLVSGSKYTLGEIRYLGYLEILLGFAGLWLPGYGVTLWAIGFGALHIIYGIAMWYKYDLKAKETVR